MKINAKDKGANKLNYEQEQFPSGMRMENLSRLKGAWAAKVHMCEGVNVRRCSDRLVECTATRLCECFARVVALPLHFCIEAAKLKVEYGASYCTFYLNKKGFCILRVQHQ